MFGYDPRLVGAIGWMAVTGLFLWAGLRVRDAEPPPLPPEPSIAELEREVLPFLRREAALRTRTAQHFPGDRWSQDDDFHAHERNFVQRLAARRGISEGDVLMAIDAALRDRERRPTGTRAWAHPCKPRPFYD